MKGACLVRHKIKTDLLAWCQYCKEVGSNEKFNIPSSTLSSPFYSFMDIVQEENAHTLEREERLNEVGLSQRAAAINALWASDFERIAFSLPETFSHFIEISITFLLKGRL